MATAAAPVSSTMNGSSARPRGLGAIDEMQEMTVGAVEARPAMPPPRKIKLRASNATNSGIAPAASPPTEAAAVSTVRDTCDRASLSERILMEGYVSSFVDFFYLMHRSKPQERDSPAEAGQDEPHSNEEMVTPPRDMVFIKDNLVRAEEARRKGDTGTVNASCVSLAKYYLSVGDPKTGVYFYDKCLEMSKLTKDVLGEMRANHSLGRVYESMGDIAKSMQYHERHRELAEAEGNRKALERASAELIGVYGKQAQECEEAAHDFQGAIPLWQASLDAAKVAGDRSAEGRACYRMGKAWMQLGELMKAIGFLDDFESIAKELEDLEGMSDAYASLSTAYKLIGNEDKSLELLTLQLDTATRTMNLLAQAEACENIAALWMRRGDHSKAKEMLARNFSITRQVVSGGSLGMPSSSVDKSRCLLSVTTGNTLLKDYLDAILSDQKALVEWKCNRAPLGKREN